MKKIILILAAASLMFCACEEQFDGVKDSSYLTGTDAAEKIEADPEFINSYVSGLYTYMVDSGNTYSGHDDFGYLSIMMISDFMGQDIAFAGSQNWGVYDYTHDYGGQQYVRCRQVWFTFYTLISKSNEILDFFAAGDPTSDVLRGYLGQAYAMRAFAYTNLMYFFQDPVNADGTLNLDTPCYPIIYATKDAVDEATSSAHSGRTPLNVVMQHIEYNLENALALLENYTRTSKNEIDYSVAQGIAARYYLYTQQWDKAVTAAQEARQGYTLMDKSRLASGFNEIEDPEVIWGFNHTTETSTVYASFFSHMSAASAGYGGDAGTYKTIDANLYSKINNSDYRKALFNGPDGDPSASTTALKQPYQNKKFGNAANWLGDYIYMRAAEMYLIEAEASVRGGVTSTALQELMKTRDVAWNKTVTLDEVLLQRRIELWGEGFSTIDLIRNGLPATRVYEGSNHAAYALVNYPAHDLLWFFQIPQSELDNNPSINDEDQTPLV